jgi:hypothetical protein
MEVGSGINHDLELRSLSSNTTKICACSSVQKSWYIPPSWASRVHILAFWRSKQWQCGRIWFLIKTKFKIWKREKDNNLHRHRRVSCDAANPWCIWTWMARKQGFRHFQHGILEIRPIKNADRYLKMSPAVRYRNFAQIELYSDYRPECSSLRPRLSGSRATRPGSRPINLTLYMYNSWILKSPFSKDLQQQQHQCW